MRPYHFRPAFSHDILDLFLHIRLIAMNLAILASRLFLLEWTLAQTK